MRKKAYSTKKGNVKQVSEPEALYGKRARKSENIAISISTLKEQEESNYLFWLSLTPEERWAEHLKLSQRIYGIKNNNKLSADRITFDV